MLIKRFVVFLFSIFLFLNGFAQKATISGIISDSFNHPLFGASVSVFGKSIGTTTDEDGKYSLDVPINISLKIILSFTGLSTDSIFVKLSLILAYGFPVIGSGYFALSTNDVATPPGLIKETVMPKLVNSCRKASLKLSRAPHCI